MISGVELMSIFQNYQLKIDKSNDKYERMVKISRDITVESKRLIFQLHRTNFSGIEEMHPEIKSKIVRLQSHWLRLGKELNGESHHQFIRAYSPGMQEYIEAVTLEFYLRTHKLMSLTQVQHTLSFCDEDDNICEKKIKTDMKLKESTQPTAQTNTQIDTQPHTQMEIEKLPQPATQAHIQPNTQLSAQPDTQSDPQPHTQIHIPLQEYLLGVADMTGEIMRVVVGRMGKVPFEEFSSICQFLRLVCDNFENLCKMDKWLTRKMSTMRQSLSKVETALYAYKLRGSEVPFNCLTLLPTSPPNHRCDEDYGDF